MRRTIGGTSGPCGDTWTYAYDYKFTVLGDPSSPDKVGPMLTGITDDHGRAVKYNLNTFSGLDTVENNESFVNGGWVSYQKTTYSYDVDPVANQYSHNLLAQIKNSWHWVDPYGQWHSRVIVQNDYSYDTNGTRTSNLLTDQNGPVHTETYGYDNLTRLTSVNYGDGQTQTYSFDNMGNRLARVDSAAGTDTLTYNAANMLLTKNGSGYTNDVNGNTLTGGGRTLTWDGQNRLTQCVNNGTTTTHTYGSDGLRRRIVQGSTITDFVLDGQSVVRTLTNGVLDRTFLHGARGPEYERIGANAPGWYAYDGLGSVLGIVDGGGNLTSVRKYDVYGGVRGLTGQSGSKHKWVGGLGHPSEDETGLVYMRARYYDPGVGRFVSEDPANWFAYCAGNPSNLADHNGKQFDLAGTLIGHGIAALIGGLSTMVLDLFAQYKRHGSLDGLNYGEILVSGLAGALFGALLAGSALGIAAVLASELAIGAKVGTLTLIILSAVAMTVCAGLIGGEMGASFEANDNYKKKPNQ